MYKLIFSNKVLYYILFIFFISVLLSFLENKSLIIEDINFSIKLKWIGNLFAFCLLPIFFLKENKNYIFFFKYFFLFISYLLIFSFYKLYFDDNSHIIFSKSVTTFNLNYNIYQYLYSRVILLSSFFIVLFTAYYLIKNINSFYLKKIIFFFFFMFVIVNLISEFEFFLKSINFEFTLFKKWFYNSKILEPIYVGKNLYFDETGFKFENILYYRAAGFFDEPSKFAFIISIFLLINFYNLYQNNFFYYFYFILLSVSFSLLLLTVSTKTQIFFFILFFVKLIYLYKKDKKIFSFFFLAFLIPVALDIMLDTNLLLNSLFKFLFYLTILIDSFISKLSLILGIDLPLLNQGLSGDEFKKIDFIDKISNFAHQSLPIGRDTNGYEIIFGSSYLPSNWRSLYLLLMGKSPFINLFLLAGFVSILFYYQIFLLIKKINFFKYINIFNILFLLYCVSFYTITTNKFGLEFSILFIIIKILIDENKYKKN